MISDKCKHYISLPKRHRRGYIATLSEEEQLVILDDIFTLINVELSKILKHLNSVSKNKQRLWTRKISTKL